jgi:hypothetical protein
MAWSIAEEINTVVITKAAAKRLFKAQEYEGEIWDSVEEIYSYGGRDGKDEGLLGFNPDHMEHMDYLWNEHIQEALKKEKVKGVVAFGDHEGDSKGEYWGYSFDGAGGMKKLSKKEVLKILAGEEEEAPKPKPKKKKRGAKKNLLSLERINDIIEMEGLAYSIQNYVSAEEIADPELRQAWADAKEALDAIEGILAEVC